HYKNRKTNCFNQSVWNIFKNTFLYICTVLVMLIAYNIVSGRVLSEVMIANLGAFAVAAFKLLPSVSALSSNFNTYIVQYTAVQAVLTNLEEARHYIVKYGKEPVTFEKSLQTKNLCFSYPKNPDKKILDNVDTEIKNGDVVGIKGSSGSGKTTYVDIILGLLEPVSGEILIDGKKLTDANVNSWREKISYVPQTAYLIDDTIRANIAFGVPEKEIDDERIKIAMKEAMLYDYVSGLPEKEMTVVGERGVQMSGGQRQRLSIARALYNNPDIIIFDEATSALDDITEKEIMESIDNLIGQKTLIIIAHRLSTLKKCNKIFEVADGKINISEK
ncbi:MAG: ABC transporter ATP-binding protein/permease, partial [Treponema sp.]|nr:ABC transporter ATP-binding protein/permease [Treponema sp.]